MSLILNIDWRYLDFSRTCYVCIRTPADMELHNPESKIWYPLCHRCTHRVLVERLKVEKVKHIFRNVP